METPTPDIVFISRGGIQPATPPCIDFGSGAIRCPAAGLESVDLRMGAGDDFLDTRTYSNPSQAGFILFVESGGGNDRWMGGPRAESWSGGAGNDNAKAGAGNDKLRGGAGNDRMLGDLGVDFFLGGPGRDFARGGKGNDRGNGGPGDDDFRD